jgi:hypothetical protein
MIRRTLAADLRSRRVIITMSAPLPTDTGTLRELIAAENASHQARRAEVVAGLVKVIAGLTPKNGDGPLHYDGTLLSW